MSFILMVCLLPCYLPVEIFIFIDCVNISPRIRSVCIRSKKSEVGKKNNNLEQENIYRNKENFGVNTCVLNLL